MQSTNQHYWRSDALSFMELRSTYQFEALLKQELENSGRPFFFVGRAAPAAPQ